MVRALGSGVALVGWSFKRCIGCSWFFGRTGVSFTGFCCSNANPRLANTLQVVGIFLILIYVVN